MRIAERATDSGRSRDSCVFDSSVLPAVWLSWRNWTCRSECQIADSATLAACRLFGFAGARFRAAISRWEAMQKAESAQRCAVLGRCRSCSPDCSFSPTHSELSCWLSDLSCG